MTSARRRSSKKLLGAQKSQTRAALMDAAAELVKSEGYSAATSRRIADKAGAAHQLIFYYFDTLDDLLVEVFRRGTTEGLVRMQAAAASGAPIRALWDIISETLHNKFSLEFVLLAQHNDALRAEIARVSGESRQILIDAIERALERSGVQPIVPASTLAVLMTAVGVMLGMEENLQFSMGHAETRALVEACIRQVELTGEATMAARAIFTPRQGPSAV